MYVLTRIRTREKKYFATFEEVKSFLRLKREDSILLDDVLYAVCQTCDRNVWEIRRYPNS